MIKVLIIDDDQIMRSLIKKVLMQHRPNEFLVIEAKDGDQGIRYALDHQPDLIICDIMMPHVDGYEAFQEIQDKSEMHIPFIFLTAKGGREDFRKGMTLGADDFITKPFQVKDLLKAIDTRIRKHTERKQYYCQKINKREEELRHITTQDSLTGLPNQFSLQRICRHF